MTKPIYGVMAEFDNPTALVNAARAAREKGYRKLDAYSPFPIEELSDALHLHQNKLPLIVLIGGILGGLTGYLLQYYVTVIYFPINIGGRPLHSWPSYIIITFELTILFAAHLRPCSGCWPCAACPCPTTRPSTCRDSRWPRATVSSCASSPPIRCSISETDRRSFWKRLEPREVSEVAH